MPDEEQPEAPAEQDAPTAEDQTESSIEDSAAAEEEPESAADEDDEDHARVPERSGGPIFSVYGIASAVLGLLSVAAIVVGVIFWMQHRDHVDERSYQNRVMGTAGSWATLLINLNPNNLEAGTQRLRERTAGPLNANFDSVFAPYRERAEKLQSRSTGRIESLAIERLHNDADAAGGTEPSNPTGKSNVGRRTDTVTVIAMSVVENPGGKPTGVRWNLQLDVSDVNGKLMISQLRAIK
ncbi:hypothetical protein [Mycobacterium shimoidei]|uniref:hypothetical protein n=1 Tax=Mycobacterium shimoidei TaxID=29313 RepID=UPI000849612B|nr:hypothetical protein [Mycobacterium shimoidei]MCV7258587.1 hypothetical protein [Mycobacterium shimoidei]ODR15473.1 hypothetical protein BHQ16_01740 [Mycobacterium shimoidei]